MAALLVVLAFVTGPASITVAGKDPSGSAAGTDGLSVTTTAPTCLDSGPFPADGWIQASRAADGTTLTMNATVAHDADHVPVISADRRRERLVLSLDATDRDAATAAAALPGHGECQTGSRVVVTAVIPGSISEVTVEIDGSTVQTVDADGLVPSVSSVSGPLDA
ncbi:hypothetical protein SAMN05216559_2438 [Halomicrobium zhouii]|uniref:Uncharacterized protein n=1 Tax=Halomicrobium zhouii TaxID=767519 RepID=A0A1I6LC21_9EURY|nr:hypothetical protein [Halomicrobium zhouii]SFS01031.1 hypothetical protein SAMN05216559_2438 [Halomicrobium zhouii]